MADFEQPIAPPAAYEVVEQVAGDVYRVTTPVPFRGLQHVHCYLLRGPDGWDMVDTGLKTPETLATWATAFAQLHITPADIHQIVLTHHHPDHMGLAGRFQQEARDAGGRRVPVRMSAREHEIVGIIWGADWSAREGLMETFFARCGLPDPAGANFSSREIGGMRRMLLPFADAVEALTPGETVLIGARRFDVLMTPGHSDGHLIFYDPTDGLLLAGDHVLSHITPNIALWPGVEPDPLGRYLNSLSQIKSLDVRRVLPGHGPVFANWKERLGELETHHEQRLEAMANVVGRGATVFDVSRQVFHHQTLDRHQARMAVAETLAHLDHLVDRNRLQRRDDEAWWYEPA